MTQLRQRLLDYLRRRNYSPGTIRGYIRAVQQFAEYFGRSPEYLGAPELRRYQLYLLHERKLAPGTVENCISALRFLDKKTLKRPSSRAAALPSLRGSAVCHGSGLRRAIGRAAAGMFWIHYGVLCIPDTWPVGIARNIQHLPALHPFCQN